MYAYDWFLIRISFVFSSLTSSLISDVLISPYVLMSYVLSSVHLYFYFITSFITSFQPLFLSLLLPNFIPFTITSQLHSLHYYFPTSFPLLLFTSLLIPLSFISHLFYHFALMLYAINTNPPIPSHSLLILFLSSLLINTKAKPSRPHSKHPQNQPPSPSSRSPKPQSQGGKAETECRSPRRKLKKIILT